MLELPGIGRNSSIVGNSPLRWRGIAGLPPVAERTQSSHDSQAHSGMKRHLSWMGYKGHVTETCDDDAAHLITRVKTCPSMQPDMTSMARDLRAVGSEGTAPCEALRRLR